MAIPKSKTELILFSEANFKKLNDHIDSLSVEEQNATFPPGTLNRNIRDVLGHLHHWHLLMLEWYEKGMAGGKPAMPAEGYTWKDVPEFNQMIQKKYSNTGLITIREKLSSTHDQLMELIEKHSEDDLYTKKKYGWTGSTSLAVYLRLSLSSHYDWAIKLIKKCRKKMDK